MYAGHDKARIQFESYLFTRAIEHLIIRQAHTTSNTMPRVFSSIKDAWNAVLSGEIVPLNSLRQVGCSSGDPVSESKVAKEGQDESMDSSICTVSVELGDSKSSEDFSLGSFSEEELRRLRTDDPFLYYSIPSARRRSFDLDADDESLMRSIRTAGRGRRRRSVPPDLLAMRDFSEAQLLEASTRVDTQDEGPMVRRLPRLSTEADPRLVCGELLREMEDMDEYDGLDPVESQFGI